MSSEHRKNIAKCIGFIGRVHNPWTVFGDFLTMAAISISNNCDPDYLFTSKEIRDEREERYLRTIKKYDRKEQLMIMSMFAELVEELEMYCGKDSIHLTDVLGEMFHELNFNDAWKGQFFTRQHVCDMTGELALDGEHCKQAVADKGYFTVNEPCCGGGAMIYGAANAAHKFGLNHNKNILVFAGDIDERCVFMT